MFVQKICIILHKLGKKYVCKKGVTTLLGWRAQAMQAQSSGSHQGALVSKTYHNYLSTNNNKNRAIGTKVKILLKMCKEYKNQSLFLQRNLSHSKIKLEKNK